MYSTGALKDISPNSACAYIKYSDFLSHNIYSTNPHCLC